jgi:hypothetical protein
MAVVERSEQVAAIVAAMPDPSKVLPSTAKQRREPLHPAVDGDVVDLAPHLASNSSTSR